MSQTQKPDFEPHADDKLNSMTQYYDEYERMIIVEAEFERLAT